MTDYLEVWAEHREMTGPEYETPELVNRVREARLHAGLARQEASRILARVSKTTVKVTSTQRRAAGAREQRRQLAAGSRESGEQVIRERVIGPRPAPLTSVGSNTPAGPASQAPFDSSSAVLRRAVAFIDEHADRQLTVADIAAASFVTVRAVQLAFRRHLDVTPMGYLRRVRLGRAHLELLAADPARGSVTAVAYRWKFASASRFTAYYRSTYGVLPSHTLRTTPETAEKALRAL
jgi:AraC-like DNA-binding protein